MIRVWYFAALILSACGGTSEGSSGNPDSGGAPSAEAGAPSLPEAGRAAADAGASALGGGSTGGTSNSGGSVAKGGAMNSGGSVGKGGATSGGASAGASSNASVGPSSACKAWPAASGSPQKLSKTVSVSKDYDGKLQRFVSDGLGDGTQGEDQLPLFELADGATLENVIIGAPAADGIHCAGTCTLKNVWWEDVGEDAATLKGSSSSQVMTVDCGGAKSASDKVFQHNGPGTMKISNFFVSNFGKLYRSCGNCSKQFARHVIFSGIRGEGGSILAGVNANYGDSATFSNIQVPSSTVICERYTGNDTGAEPPKLGAGADGKVCIYTPSDIHAL